ncbi:LacI family DNA-binding transcriptional regulator [Streptomyces vietnamensis]|uniref:LacI family DNA-binding transcriptional regulator n=1 Tax=Streptomyces vietnamensis TaxID=362257 RepID=UPI000697A00E|nr:LacI family DNA-binding transcriptional regulator [Streptomyces vietnamensis]
MSRRKKGPGIREIAEAAGVSMTTVSHALNGKGEVAQETRRRVQEIAARLGYSPDPIARGLVTGRVGVIGVVIRHMASEPWEATYGPFYTEAIAGATLKAVEYGHALVVVPVGEGLGTWSRVPMDGVLVVDPQRDDPLLADCRRRGLDAVTSGRPLDDSDFPWVNSDRETGMRAVLDHLHAQGARRIALLSGAPTDSYTVDCQELYRQWCAEHGVRPVVEAPKGGDTAADAADRLLSADERPDAVHCINETYGLAVISACRRLGLSIPGDLLLSSAAAGPYSDFGGLPVTTLSLGARESGMQMADLLIRRLRGEPTPTSVTVPVRLTVRESTDGAR